MKTKLKYHKYSSIVMGGKVVLPLLAITTVSGLVQSGVFSGSSVLASGSAVDTLTVTVKSACSLESTVLSEHNAILVPGIYSGSYIASDDSTPYASGIGSTKLTTMCNDDSGYAIYAIGYTNDTEGTTTLVGQATNQTIASGTATSGDTSNWAMKLTKVEDSSVSYSPTNLTIEGGYDDFSTVPSTYTKVASFSTSTDSTLGSQLTTTYAVYLKPSQVADTYVGKVKYTLVHPAANDPSSYYVSFYANGGTGTMTSQKIGATTATQLTANSFTAPEGKVFNGWNTQADGNGTSYADGAEVTAIAEAGGAINLYAQWKGPLVCNPSGTTIGTGTDSDIVCMQDFAALDSSAKTSVLSSMAFNEQYILADSRDEKEYYISKLEDGHVWMTQNLDLNLETTPTNVAALTSGNTDLNQYGAKNYDSSNGYTCKNSEAADCDGGVITWTPERATIAKDALNNTIWQDSISDPYSYQYGNTVLDGTNAYEGHKYVGTYYNWSAAIASNNSAAFNSNTLNDISFNPKNSICPKGWRLPTIANSTAYPGTEPNSPNEFRRLNVLYNNNATNNATNLMNAPLYFSRSGNVIGGSVGSSGLSAIYWSSTVGGSGNAYILLFGASIVYPEYNNYRYGGFSVRCVAK